MARFLALQGSAHQTHQSAAYELQDGVDIDALAAELASAVTLDRVVQVPAVLPQSKGRRQKVTLYVRPAAWALWTFYELSEEDKKALVQENPLLNALLQGVQQRGQAGQPGPVHNPLFGGQ
ncbi:Uncharacterised protein [Mycolicibacterium phlei]|jgi:hypothetical protein|uniref:Uncharacterized protein n=1 Tax=Mycolicibacterium phlei DSM 43239 = CCUG 21000 TaxID=1226750 RepID=A0A5N5UUM0_MYCPH|nr:hypothetical protein [Mycolicibacterium phlei]VEG07602.1 Uncharacterised protein [Mycobacteroides chelonae]AMO59472.1 hypothetical protein MPHLCCUG_00634 [Mycolicibacterium phlei]EID09825.1 hypothetical protein MPHLEI_23684 [Mycolicibacterium phlei RIVM601174]KAB7753311.1 hypothetical protein MPHL21000_18860 [Mycolicibacterium phlei DSM 43239 = CCUG 21000]KXW62212.1 hypothetical protein MPHL43239_17925 [Mycolicibacterium phlei DSM 43239 = CCUG 21000]